MTDEQVNGQSLPKLKVTVILTIQQDGVDTKILRSTEVDEFIQPAFEKLLLAQLATAFPDSPKAGVAVLVHAISGYMSKFVETDPEDQGSKLLYTVCEKWLEHEARKFWEGLSPDERVQHMNMMTMLSIPQRQEMIDQQMKKKIDEHTEEQDEQ